MGRHDDIGYPHALDDKKMRKDLIDQIDRDQRDEAVHELSDEAWELYLEASGSVVEHDERAGIEAVMKLCWERWSAEAAK